MKLHLLVVITFSCPVFAQSPAIPIAVGYSEPAPFQAAPGQVVTLFLDDIPSGVNGAVRSAQATVGDLPTSLAGVAVRITQLDGTELQAPIFAVRQDLKCGLSGVIAGDAACMLTVVKVQVPFELQGDLVLRDGVYSTPFLAQLSIDVDGRRGRGFAGEAEPGADVDRCFD